MFKTKAWTKVYLRKNTTMTTVLKSYRWAVSLRKPVSSIRIASMRQYAGRPISSEEEKRTRASQIYLGMLDHVRKIRTADGRHSSVDYDTEMELHDLRKEFPWIRAATPEENRATAEMLSKIDPRYY